MIVIPFINGLFFFFKSHAHALFGTTLLIQSQALPRSKKNAVVVIPQTALQRPFAKIIRPFGSHLVPPERHIKRIQAGCAHEELNPLFCIVVNADLWCATKR